MNTLLKLDLISAEHKLVRILPEQIPATWEFILPFIEDSLIDSADEGNMTMVFNNLISGLLEAWVLVRKGDNKNWTDGETAAVVTLQFTQDSNTGSRSLFLYTLSGLEYLSDEVWADMSVAVAEYARASNCTNVVAVSSNARVIQVFKKAGAEVESRYMTLKVGV